MGTTIEPTPAQRVFLESDAEYRCLYGGRQIGKTTVLAKDAIEQAKAGKTVALTSYTHRMAMVAMDRVRELACKPENAGRTIEANSSEIVFVGGGRIRVESTDRLAMGGTGPEIRGEEGTISGVDHLAVDEVDYVDSGQFDSILTDLDDATVSVVGSPVNPSPNLSWIDESEAWASTHESMYSAPHIDDGRVDEMEAQFSIEQVCLEVAGVILDDE